MIDLMELAEKRKMPDIAIRAGIRKLLRDRLKLEKAKNHSGQLEALYGFIDMMKSGPVAVATDTANEQHYEVPSELFQTFMGPHLKYSSGYWPSDATTLEASEAAMLELTCKRAGLEDGMDILELGCGWGSLSLWMAQQYPNSKITAVSNSNSQRKFIHARGFKNLNVITADMNEFATDRKFDRVVSVEMFEHMRNWPELLRRISGWLKDDGRLFIHIFVHRELAYLFNEIGQNNWMAENFFKEGMMPAEELLPMCNGHLEVERHWHVNGRHYAKTLRAWLNRIDQNEKAAIAILEPQHGKEEARLQFGRWRIFFMACEELFGCREGEEWYVAHYLLKQR
ncbi:SAM-dependent methyltransferase [Pontiella sulfatireligans]|uniref:Cyclopropane-fatty-acyl-phospholipid synthase n=1 Tax=Pontiella sulfatireligans TaxID=2750658 RepID=A0A6C2UMD3_9BACT|nr:cyclopropane-fatty-acyl-phospholipid synthase family protein [Pontiella sulfatireligans]VGO21159.1 Cyclopropane-fatty-acyl-phospholipid synthase [Pontiella sulfatireligans]